MKLRPREQWICDTCGEVIEKATDGWCEWLRTDQADGWKKYAFRIVHHASASPRNPHRPNRRQLRSESCYQYDARADKGDCHLDRLVGPEGLPMLLAMVDVGPIHDETYSGPWVKNLREWTELVRRLALPHYEEARQYWDQALSQGYLSGGQNEYAIYSQETLRRIIEDFADREDERGDQ